MKFKQSISITEFTGKKYKVRLIETDPIEQKQAIVTHYLHNINNGASKYFKKEAEKTIKEYIKYKKEEENFSIVAEDAMQQLLFEVNNVPFTTPENYTFKFIDLFAGIGGFRLAMQNLGGKCIFTSEWDKEAQKNI
jgi:DNA (cytosine-5)-methyltransferase 1